MCTLVILRRPGHGWPVVLAANRDEMADRRWRPPGRHWPDRPEIVGGHDALAGGTWLGLNDQGVAAGIMNRRATLGPEAGKRSRGELVLEALDHADADAAAVALADLDGTAYRPFNMVIADNRDGYWLANRGDGRGIVEVRPLPAGLSMITAEDRNDPACPRIAAHLARFEAAEPPAPDATDWADWERLMADRDATPGADPRADMCVVTDGGFGTLSSSLIALPAPGPARSPVWRFAAGRPGEAPYRAVAAIRTAAPGAAPD